MAEEGSEMGKEWGKISPLALALAMAEQGRGSTSRGCWEHWSLPGGPGPDKEWVVCTVAVDRRPGKSFQYSKDYPNIKLIPTCKIRKGYFQTSKHLQTLPEGR
jgi:hypothetical protein